MTTTIAARADQLRTSGVPFVQATVVRAQEPSSARPGDRAIILADGSMEGFVGGHCAAGSVRTAALGALGTRREPAAAGAARRQRRVPRVARRQHRGQPVPVRRRPGDLPRAAAATGRPARHGHLADRRGAGRPGRRPRLRRTACGRRRPGGRHRGGGRDPRRRGRTGAGRARRRASGSWAWSAATPAAPPSSPSWRSRRRRPRGCTCTSGSTSAPARPPSSPCRSWPPWSAPIRVDGLAASGASPAPRPTEAVDPVCGMTVTIGPDTAHAVVDGVDHWFCHTGCRTRFLETHA